MATSDVKLLGAPTSPYVIRVQFALNFKSIDYELIREDLSNKSELLLKSNPVHKKIPVLIHANKPICESLVIVEYIDKVWTEGPSLLPSDPYDIAVARFWAAYIDQKWVPTLGELRRAQDEESKSAAVEKVFGGLMLLEGAFAECSKGKAFFGGDTIGYLDIAFGCYLGWLKVGYILTGWKLLDESKTPGLVKWAANFLSQKATENIIPETEALIEYMNKQFQASAAKAASK